MNTVCDRDWPEDFEHENGNYMNTCCECKNTFTGHKRRLICKACSTSQGGEAVVTDAFVPGSLADLLFQLGEKGIQVSGGTHGDHWAVALPGASVAVPAHSDDVSVPRELLERVERYFSGFVGDQQPAYALGSKGLATIRALLNGGRDE